MQIFGTWGPSPGSEASEGQKAVLRLAFCLEGLDAGGPLFEARCARLGRSGPGQGEWSLKSRQVGHFPTRVVPGKPIDPGSSMDGGQGWLGLGAWGGDGFGLCSSTPEPASSKSQDSIKPAEQKLQRGRVGIAVGAA